MMSNKVDNEDPTSSTAMGTSTTTVVGTSTTTAVGTCPPEKTRSYVSFSDTAAARLLLQGIELITGQLRIDENISDADNNGEIKVPLNLVVSDAMACSLCNAMFENKTEQHFHYKSDWHHFNLKQQLKSLPLVTEDDFCTLTECDDLSSLSGSESDDTDDISFSALNINVTNATENEDEPTEMELYLKRQPKVYFRNNDGLILSVHRCVLQSKKDDKMSGIAAVAAKIPDKIKWAYFLTGGGHFAGAIFNFKEVLMHKTFHRYTVRAKRGTTQSSRDNQSNSAPKSAGASLRRHNEMALSKEISELIISWSDDLDQCSHIFIRAPSSNKAIFFGGKTPLFNKKDANIRFVPFGTRRPTFKELRRVHDILSSITCYDGVTDIENVLSSPSKACKTETAVKELTHSIRFERSTEDNPTKIVRDEADSTEDSDCRIELVYTEETFETSNLQSYEVKAGDLNDFVSQKKLPRRRKKRKNKEKIEEDGLNDVDVAAVDEAAVDETTGTSLVNSELQNSLFTCCRTGNIEQFLNAIDNFSKIVTNCPDSRTDVDRSHSAMNNDNDIQSMLHATLNSCFGETQETMLHVASRSGHQGIISALLEAGSDPTLKNNIGQVPYILAERKDLRNEFRSYMGRHPNRYDYKAAQIPSPLYEHKEAARKSKDAERRKQNKLSKRERLKDQKIEEAKVKQEEIEQRRFVNLSDREKRALAAERRLLHSSQTDVAPVLTRCWKCGADITGKVPFEYYEYRFCSTKCLKAHRQESHKSAT